MTRSLNTSVTKKHFPYRNLLQEQVTTPNFTCKYLILAHVKFSENLRPKINDAIALLQDKTCLTFQEVDQSYTGDHIKMFQGNGLENTRNK